MNNGMLFIIQKKKKIKRSLIASTYNYYSLCSNTIYERIQRPSIQRVKIDSKANRGQY